MHFNNGLAAMYINRHVKLINNNLIQINEFEYSALFISTNKIQLLEATEEMLFVFH